MNDTTRTRLTTRPNGHPERLVCMAFAAPLLVSTTPAHPVIEATLRNDYAPAEAAYSAARVANELASTDVDLASAALAARATAFGTAFRAWTVSIDRANRLGFAATALRPELGARSISDFVRAPARDILATLVTLGARVGRDPALAGDPADWADVGAAAVALDAAATAFEAAVPVRHKTSTALKRASAAFDAAWGLLVKDARRYDKPNLGAEVPRFRRTVNTKAAATAAACDPPADAVGAEGAHDVDGTDGTDGSDGTDGTDAVDAPSSDTEPAAR